MKRALMYASVASMIQQFNMENIRILQDMGYEVDVACNMEKGSTITEEKVAAMKQELQEMGVQVHHIPVPRKITALGAIVKSFQISKRLMNERQYDLIHCHSPIGGIICRAANRCCKEYRKTKMVYTAHGFHFFKGGPKSSWILFYPAEKLFSRYTDVLITINQEDFALAKECFHAKEVIKVPGVGVDTRKYRECIVDREALRTELGVAQDDTLVLSVGELNRNKNHSVIIRAIHKLQNPKIHYAVVGKGDYRAELERLIEELGMQKQVSLLGYRSDIPALCNVADVFAFASKREGLGLAAIEAMAAGVPIVTSNVQGITDYSVNGVTGFCCDPLDVDAFAEGIRICTTDLTWVETVKKHNEEAAKRYDFAEVNKIMKEIYSKC